MKLKAKDFIKFLEIKGFVKTRHSGSHVIMKGNNNKTVAVPYHNQKNEINKVFLMRLLRDADVNIEEYKIY